MAQEAQGIASLPMAQEVQRVTGGGQMARRQRPDIDPMSRAQALNVLGAMTGVGGYADMLGQYPQMPAEDVTVSEMLQGPPGPSFAENLREGEYVDATLQALGAIPLVGAAAKGARAGRLVRSTSDASDTFGKGAQEITLSDPVSGGRIKLLARPGEPNSVLSLYVDEEFRGQGVGKALQDAALAEGPLMGQVSSKAAAVNAYRAGRRPVDKPNASLEEVFAAIDRDSSVNMATPDLLPSAALKGPRAFQRALQLASAKQLPADEMEGLYRTLVEIGYPEATAAKIARGDLPMDEASRMARAREQGFNPDDPVYHGTANDIKSFEYAAMGARDPGFVGKGVYTTSEPKIAEFYASRAVPRGLDASGPNVMELLTRGGNYQQLSLEEKMRLGQAVRGNPEIAQNLTDELMSRGMIGAEVRDATGALVERANYNPSDIRSPRAAFDPEQMGSANILASPAAAGLGAAYLAAMQSRNENE